MIAQLKTSVHKFNEIQAKHEQEKLSLCYELNEMNQVKKKLSEILDIEVKKNAMLGQSKEAIVKTVNSQVSTSHALVFVQYCLLFGVYLVTITKKEVWIKLNH